MRLQRLSWLLPYLIPAAFAFMLLLFYPFRFRFEFDTDEGIQLIKAFLYLKGYALQTEIFSDQPPLFTVVLAALFNTLGPSVLVARLAVLAFSCLLLISGAVLLKTFYGGLHSFVALILLATLPYFVPLSVSVMIGLPAIALAMLALLALGQWRRTGRTGWMLFSSIALALSVLTKLFTVILVPVFIAGMLLSISDERPGEKTPVRRWMAIGIWLGVLIGAGLILLRALVGAAGWPQMIVTARDARNFAFEGREVGALLPRLWPLLVLATAGGVLSVARRSWAGMCLFGWFVLGIVFLVAVHPVWYHQQLLMSVPAAMLASIAVSECFLYLRQLMANHAPIGARGLLCVAGFLLFVGLLGFRIQDSLQGFKARLPNLIAGGQLNIPEYEAIAIMGKCDPGGSLLITDRPMYAFRSLREVPPELAVFSLKRLTTGWLTEEDVIASVDERRPKVVLLGRFRFPLVSSYLKSRYQKVTGYPGPRLFIRDWDGVCSEE